MKTTRKSLILRIQDVNDADAWSHFVEIYGPLIYRYACRRGLQDADAADLSQAVLTEVSQCIERFEYDASLGRFRNWLLVIARYKLNRHSKKQARHSGSGDSKIMQLLDQQPAEDEMVKQWEIEYQEHLFRWAAEQICNEVEKQTWEAFYRTSVNNEPPAAVAKELNMKVGSVYVAKSRVLLRIREKIATIDDST